MQITKDMTIEDVVQRFPETIQVFSRYGVGCLGCSAAQYDSIGQGAAIHGLDAAQLVQELNACIAARA
jgi:hybrid cluster-associated redox disulfide protein